MLATIFCRDAACKSRSGAEEQWGGDWRHLPGRSGQVEVQDATSRSLTGRFLGGSRGRPRT
eukprot:479518-Alexandrium_andersonii.AAC.1